MMFMMIMIKNNDDDDVDDDEITSNIICLDPIFIEYVATCSYI